MFRPTQIVLLSSLTLVCLSSFSCAQPQGAPPPALIQILQQAQAMLGQQQFSAAEKLLQDAALQYPNRPSCWYLLGYSRHAQKNYDTAMEAYEKANTIAQGKAPNTLYNMACIHALRGESEQAFSKLDEAVKAGFSNFTQLNSDPELVSLRNDKRFQNYQPKWLEDDELFVESTRIIHKWAGEAAGDQFGWTARRVGDIDADGVIDFVATAPTFNSGAGKIYVYSSKTGKLIHEVTGASGYRLGNSAVGLGDINGDNIPDVIAGAPAANGKGLAIVYSGKDASELLKVQGTTAKAQFGYEVSELGDINGDAIPDFFVGEIAGVGKVPGSGRGVAYSGKDATVLFELKGEKQGDNFGNAAAATRLEDGTTLLAIGAQNAGPKNSGRVYVYEVKNSKPKLKFTIKGDQSSVNLGQMFISFPGDLDQDGIPDVYASDFSDNSGSPGGGKVVVHSGADGKELLALRGQVPGEGLGTSPSDAGDVDGDGIGDLVIGAWQNREGAASGGKVYLYSCANGGSLLDSWTCKQSGDTLGFDACGIGDVDGDGAIDFLLTSAWSNVHGLKTGRVFIVAGKHYSKPDSNAATKLKATKVETLLDDIDGGSGGLNIDTQGNLYTADFGWRLDGQGKGGHQLFKVSQDGTSSVFCSSLRGGSGNTIDAQGNIYQSSIGGNFISKISPEGQATTFCNTGLKSPVGLVFDSRGDLFACNCGSNSIQKIGPNGQSSLFCDSKLLNCPNGITVGPDDSLYVCNFSNGDVVRIDRKGNAIKLATLPGNNNGHLIYHRGLLYVLARKDCRVYQIDLAGRVSVFAGSGQRGSQDGQPDQSSFSLPNSLIISPDEQAMFVNEVSPTSGDHRILGPTRIRKISLAE